MNEDSLSTDQFETLTKAVNRAARVVAFSWPETVVAEDLEQELYIEILESPATLEAVVTAEAPVRHRMLVRLGHRAAGKARDSYDYFTGNYRYSVDDVKRMLSGGVLDLDSVRGLDGAALDLEEAISILWESTPQYAEAITARYTNGFDAPSNGADKTRLSRALTSLTDGMNRNFKARSDAHSDGPGSRKAIPNHTALAKTKGYS